MTPVRKDDKQPARLTGVFARIRLSYTLDSFILP